MNFIIDIQVALDSPEPELPKPHLIKKWLTTALSKFKQNGEVSVRIVNEEEIQALNSRYRQKDKPTNVLSFPADLPEGIELEHELLGDIVISSPVVKQEAITQNKTYTAHFAHMLIHGLLHLLGFDHQNDQEAEIMEKHEINILHELDFSNPYHHL